MDRFIASRDLYEGDNETEESLECFDKAMRKKISAIFYIFSSENDDYKGA
ncbi:hypothetical protein [Bacillus cereus]|nr:hypothetical protein [Bacillus cereus]